MQKNATTIGFYGATETVTGSKYLVRFANGRKVLVDCGLFQGYKQLRERNWSKLPFAADSIDEVLLTHAHIDHSGYLPALVRDGFRGPIYCSAGTRDLCKILLPDSGRLHEADADYANRKGFSRHAPALPLYTERDAEVALEHFQEVDFGQPLPLGDRSTATFHRAGHILGASYVHVADGEVSTLFSGDLGRPNDLMMRPPAPPRSCDVLVMEATYGGRTHDTTDMEQRLGEIVAATVEHGGTLVIPAFAVGRTQLLLLMLYRLRQRGAIPEIPIYVDSPMATAATRVYQRHLDTHRLDHDECEDVAGVARYVRDAEASMMLDAPDVGPQIIVSASGMATGGRVIHHLKRFLPDPHSSVLFAGFQAGGTRGASLVQGAKEVKIHGEWVPIRAHISSLDSLSAHADEDEIVRWLRQIPKPPKRVFITHGELQATDALRMRIQREFGWDCHVPSYRDTYVLP